jgi:hypothetical protein
MERIAAAALKQSQRNFRLRILEPMSINEMESHMQQADCSLLADGTGPPLLTLLPEIDGVCLLPPHAVAPAPAHNRPVTLAAGSSCHRHGPAYVSWTCGQATMLVLSVPSQRFSKADLVLLVVCLSTRHTHACQAGEHCCRPVSAPKTTSSYWWGLKVALLLQRSQCSLRVEP